MSVKTKGRAKKGESNPKFKPISIVIDVENEVWLLGIPPLPLKSLPHFSFFDFIDSIPNLIIWHNTSVISGIVIYL